MENIDLQNIENSENEALELIYKLESLAKLLRKQVMISRTNRHFIIQLRNK